MSDQSHDEEQAGPEYVVLDGLKKLRACFVCHLIKTENQFRKEGCDNCLYFKHINHSYPDYTSPNFEGLVSVIDPEISWVARHLNVHRLLPGTYCLRIKDEITGDILETLKEYKISYANNLN